MILFAIKEIRDHSDLSRLKSALNFLISKLCVSFVYPLLPMDPTFQTILELQFFLFNITKVSSSTKSPGITQ